MLAQHGLADAQSETGSAPWPFRGEERIEDVRQIFGCDSWAIILKHDPNGVRIASDAHTNRALFAAFADCLLRIQQKNKKDLHQLIGIGHDSWDGGFGQKVDGDIALAQRVGLHLHGALHQFIQIDLAASRSGGASELLQVLDDFGSAPRLFVQN